MSHAQKYSRIDADWKIQKQETVPTSLMTYEQVMDKGLHEDVDKIEKLSMINANARFELLNANQQLLDFQMNRYMRGKKSGPSTSRVLKYQSDSQNTAKTKIPADLLNYTTKESPKKKTYGSKAAVPPIKRYKEDENKKPHHMVKNSVNHKQPIELDKEIYKYNSYQY